MNKTEDICSNQNIIFHGKTLTISGDAVRVGEPAPNFRLVDGELNSFDLGRFKGRGLLISVVPSIDTSTCEAQTKRFNSEAEQLGKSIAVLTVSLDLPFAQSRWSSAAGAKFVDFGSAYRNPEFGVSYGVFIEELALFTRAVFVLDKDHVLRYVEYTQNISDEPNYEQALKVLKAL